MSSPSRLPSGPISYPVSQPAFWGRGGPHVFNGNWYVIEVETASQSGPIDIVAYKSTDQGITWTRFASGLTTHNGDAAVWYPGSGSSIYFAYQDDVGPTSTFRGGVFDMASETFGGAFSTGTTIGRFNLIALNFATMPSGKWVFMWTDLLVGVLNAIVSTDSGATWGAPIAISGATPFSALESGPIINIAGNLAINWTQWLNNSYFNFARVREYCSIFDGTTVLHTNVALSDASKVGLQDGFQYSGWYDAASDSLIYPTMQTLSSTHLQVNLLVGTPSANPIFSTVIVKDNPAASNDFYWAPNIVGNASGTAFYVFWSDDIGTFPFQTVLREAVASTLAGPWSESIFYDQQANPPTPTPNFGELFPVTVTILPSGIPAVIVGMAQTIVPSENWCGVLYFLSGSPSALTLPCPIASPGTVGVPFTETLIASGGTPPYAYAVAPGYSLPPGLTLDPATGIISGTPTTAGTFNIAYMVTDSLGNTATTIGTCPIPISGPGTGGACDNPGTNPSLDSYLELRKVLVAWKKETHLPIRGKS